MVHDGDTEEWVDPEEYEEETEEYVTECKPMNTEKESVDILASGPHEPVIVKLGVNARGMKRSSPEVNVNEDMDLRCVAPAHVDPKRSKQGCASSPEIAPVTKPKACLRDLPHQLANAVDWPEGEILSGPTCLTSRPCCRPCFAGTTANQ